MGRGMVRIRFKMLEELLRKETGKEINIRSIFRNRNDFESDSFSVIGDSQSFNMEVPQGGIFPYYDDFFWTD